MKKTCSQCYHCTNQGTCDINGQKVNTTKQRDKCKNYRVNPPREYNDNGYGYGSFDDMIGIMTKLTMMGHKKGGDE